MSTSHRVAFRYRLARGDREALADLEHDRWSRWMRHQFSKGTFNDDGTWTMPAESVDRWKRQKRGRRLPRECNEPPEGSSLFYRATTPEVVFQDFLHLVVRRRLFFEADESILGHGAPSIHRPAAGYPGCDVGDCGEPARRAVPRGSSPKSQGGWFGLQRQTSARASSKQT